MPSEFSRLAPPKYRHKKKRRGPKRIPKPNPTKPTTLTAFSQQKRVLMRYFDRIQVDPGVGTGFYAFRANSIADPDYTGTGHQAYGHDQYALFYNHYQVVGAQIKVTATVNTTANQSAILWGIRLSDTTTFDFTDERDCIESGQTNYSVLPLNRQVPQVLKQNFSATKYFNVKKPMDSSREDLGAAFNASPNEAAFFQVWYKTLDVLDDPNPIDLAVQIDYIVQMTEPKPLSLS